MHAIQRARPTSRKRSPEAKERQKQEEAGVHPHDDGPAGLLQGQLLRTYVHTYMNIQASIPTLIFF
jgi:hypothetical protein